VGRTIAICRRELAGYVATPPAYLCLIGFPLLSGASAFLRSDFFATGQADLDAFFTAQPWLYLGMAPLLSMRLWAAETEGGTIELLLTLPVRPVEAVIGKFLAGWCIAGIALALTWPLWLTVNLLGRPDNGLIFAGYAASWLLAGALLAIGETVSAASASQPVAFIATAVALSAMTALGRASALDPVYRWLPANLASGIAATSPTRHFRALISGDVALSDLVYFVSVIIGALAAATLIVDRKTAD
jgi:ABC-2 type transport system permease protein